MKTIDQLVASHLETLGIEALPASVMARIRGEVTAGIETSITRKIAPKFVARCFAESLRTRAGNGRGAVVVQGDLDGKNYLVLAGIIGS